VKESRGEVGQKKIDYGEDPVAGKRGFPRLAVINDT